MLFFGASYEVINASSVGPLANPPYDVKLLSGRSLGFLRLLSGPGIGYHLGQVDSSLFLLWFKAICCKLSYHFVFFAQVSGKFLKEHFSKRGATVFKLPCFNL